MDNSTASQNLDELKAGNARFIARVTGREPASRHPAIELVETQAPRAAVLCCSDARVPPEIVFDQGLGALFTVRVAGNVATTPELASLEYAVEILGVQLIVVLGHSQCGAVTAAVRAAMSGQAAATPALKALVDEIKPVADAVVTNDPHADENAQIDSAVHANVQQQIQRLPGDSALLAEAMNNDRLVCAGAVYTLHDGRITFV